MTMSTSGRGPPPHHNEYPDHDKSRRKNFHSTSFLPNSQKQQELNTARTGQERLLVGNDSRDYSRTNSHGSFPLIPNHTLPHSNPDGWPRLHSPRNGTVRQNHHSSKKLPQQPSSRSTLNTTRGKRDNAHNISHYPGNVDRNHLNSLHHWTSRLPVASSKQLSNEEVTAVAAAALEAFTSHPDMVALDIDYDEEMQEETFEAPLPRSDMEASPIMAHPPVVDVTLHACDLLELEIAYTTAYPLTLIDTQYNELCDEFKSVMPKDGQGNSYSKYSPMHPIKTLSEYPCYNRNISKFKHTKHLRLLSSLKSQRDSLRSKKLKLVREYQDRNRIWQREREWMDQQIRLLHPPDDEMRREIDSLDIKKQQLLPLLPVEPEPIPDQIPQSSRRSRGRRGDLVASEAEFQEILQTLGKELDEDPIIRAERHAATIPDLILDPVQRYYVRFMDSNNVVRDKDEWALRVKTDFIDNFSELEHKLFCEAWCLYPKKFGAISRHIGGLRTALDCVVHYYATKKQVNYKQLLLQYKKKAAAARKSRKSKSLRSRNSPQSQSSENPSLGDFVIQQMDSPEAPIIGLLGQLDVDDVKTRKRSSAPKDEKNRRKRKKEDETEVSESQAIPITTNGTDGNMVHSQASLAGRDSETIAACEDADSTSDDKKLSYWSITEILMFPDLLLKHGSRWNDIAEELLTKSAVMVRNYFLRNADKYNWSLIVETVDNGMEVPLGLFRHQPPTASVQTEQLAKVNINLLLSDTSPTKPTVLAPVNAAVIPQAAATAVAAPSLPSPPIRSSIMSLLNTETESNPAVVVPAHHQNKLLDILNSLPAPQIPVVVAPSRSSKHKLADLLSAEPN